MNVSSAQFANFDKQEFSATAERWSAISDAISYPSRNEMLAYVPTIPNSRGLVPNVWLINLLLTTTRVRSPLGIQELTSQNYYIANDECRSQSRNPIFSVCPWLYTKSKINFTDSTWAFSIFEPEPHSLETSA